jgi:creatinine amidohydrolase
MVLPGELAGCGQNLAAKFVEGFYVAPPRMVETLELVHGTFQQLKARPVPVWVLGEDRVSIRARDLLELAGMKPFHVPVPELAGAMPLALELLFNPALVDGVRRLGLDQVNWPGKGLDGPLYGFEGGV